MSDQLVFGRPVRGLHSSVKLGHTICAMMSRLILLVFVTVSRQVTFRLSNSLSFIWQVHPHEDSYPRMIELWFLFSLIWSICASVDEDSRKKMDNFLREIEGQFPAKVMIINSKSVLYLPE